MALVDELPYQPFRERGNVVGGEFRWRLGLRPLDLVDWFEFGGDGNDWVAEKPRIMAAHADAVFAALDDAEPECVEVAEAVSAHVGAPLDPRLHPLDAAARLVPDDLVVMVERDDRLVFGAGSVCFPNRWDLRSKLGLTMAQVHQPVAELNEQLGHAVDDVLERLSPDRSYWRLGWGIIDSPDGFEPPRPGAVGDLGRVDRSVDLTELLYLRVERETLRRFPRTQAVLFGIRTYIAPMDRVVADRSAAEAIAAVVGAMPADVRAYKDLAGIGDQVVGNLKADTL